MNSDSTVEITVFTSVKDNTGSVARTIWPTFVDRTTNHRVGPKATKLIAGALFCGTRAQKNVLSRTCYLLDIETNKATGEVPPDADQVRAEMQKRGWAGVIYSTHSHTQEAPRYRVALPPETAIDINQDPAALAEDGIRALGLAAALGLAGVVDGTKLGAESMFYLPTHAPDAPHFGVAVEGRAITAAELAEALEAGKRLRADEDQYQEAAQEQRPARGDSVIAAYNASATVAELLERHGYKRRPRSTVDWRSKYQTSEGTFATRVIDARWVTLSASDIAAGLGRRSASGVAASGDAFDLYCHYEHRGDQRVAMRAAAKALGLDARKPADDWADAAGVVASSPDYVTDGKGYPVANAHNILEFLTHDDEFAGMFATDTFANKRVLLRQIPGIPGPRNLMKPLVLTESHIASILARIQRRLIPRATKAMVCDALDIVFPRSTMHPVRAYLDPLQWDGIARVDGWLTAYLGATGDAQEARYITAAGRAWIISAVARVYAPGCKADAALILEGAQGIGKSTTASLLAGLWFGDALPHLGTKDAASYLQGLWIVELAELANMARAEVEIVKSFMSRTEDRFRPAYARLEVSVPRQCVFIGSTNADNYLRDTTGNRRFWPVRCGVIDTVKLAADRDQLWAEAVHLYQAGEKWWLEREIAEIANGQQQERVDTDDPLTGRVVEIARGLEESGVSVAQIVHDLFPDKRDQTLLVSRRIGQILRNEGWAQRGFTRPSSTYGKQKRFIRKFGA